MALVASSSDERLQYEEESLRYHSKALNAINLLTKLEYAAGSDELLAASVILST